MSQPTTPKLNITVLISGNGSNLQAIIDNTLPTHPRAKLLNARVTHVISNRKAAYGLERARKAKIPTTYHNLLAYKSRYPDPTSPSSIAAARRAYDADLASRITTHTPRPDLVLCAGWMHILDSSFVDTLSSLDPPLRIINLHPALPGQFNGAEAIHRAYLAYQRGEIMRTGCMVHHVIGEVDMGEPVMVKEVECRPGESEAELETRIHEVEWSLIVEATAKVLGEIEEERRAGEGGMGKRCGSAELRE